MVAMLEESKPMRSPRPHALLKSRTEPQNPIGEVGLVSDITERKRAEQLLHLHYAVTPELAQAPSLHQAPISLRSSVSAFWTYCVLFWDGFES